MPEVISLEKLAAALDDDEGCLQNVLTSKAPL